MKELLVQAALPHLTLEEVEWLCANDEEFNKLAEELFENASASIARS